MLHIRRLCDNKKNKVYLPEPPFSHAEVPYAHTYMYMYVHVYIYVRTCMYVCVKSMQLNDVRHCGVH